MPSDLDKMARRLYDLEGTVHNLRTRERPSYAAGFISDLAQYPHLRGLWTFGPIDEGENITDVSGQARTLFAVGSPTYGLLGNRYNYAILDGSTQYFTRAGIDISGALTLGGWFYFSSTPASSKGLISKYNAAGNNRSYRLNFNGTTGTLIFSMSQNGSTTYYVESSIVPVEDTWYFIVGKYVPSTSVNIFVNGTLDTNTTSIPSSIYISTAYFVVGANSDYTTLLDGRVGLSFIYASALDDSQIGYIYQKTKVMFSL